MDLLEESFPGIQATIKRCEELGFQWGSKNFCKKEGSKILSHVSLLDYPILIEGKWHQAASLHGVCTKETHRGKGYASELIQEALAWAEPRYETILLFTDIPTFYEKFSFKQIQEYRFHLPCKRNKGSKFTTPLTFPKDNAQFLRCFENRVPLSNRLWVEDRGAIASFNALFTTYPTFWSLHYSPTLNGLISFKLEGKTLHLFDVIADKIPSLEVIVDHMPSDIDEIYFYFSPDAFTNDAKAEPYTYDNGRLLVHGKWETEHPFMIAPLSRC